jgi:hypothetical protein
MSRLAGEGGAGFSLRLDSQSEVCATLWRQDHSSACRSWWERHSAFQAFFGDLLALAVSSEKRQARTPVPR